MRRKTVEKEAEETDQTEHDPTAANIVERDCQPRKKYRKRNPLADYNKPPVPKISATKDRQVDTIESAGKVRANDSERREWSA